MKQDMMHVTRHDTHNKIRRDATQQDKRRGKKERKEGGGREKEMGEKRREKKVKLGRKRDKRTIICVLFDVEPNSVIGAYMQTNQQTAAH
eukprot:11661083-Ditylum_brightwellii.AAC.1